jgi:hypothetical protein
MFNEEVNHFESKFPSSDHLPRRATAGGCLVPESLLSFQSWRLGSFGTLFVNQPLFLQARRTNYGFGFLQVKTTTYISHSIDGFVFQLPAS